MNKKSKILIFGASNCGVEFYKNNRVGYKVIGFVDNDKNKKGNKIFGLKIFGPMDISALSFDKIVIASDYHSEIYKQLVEGLNINPEKVVRYFDERKESKRLRFKNRFVDGVRQAALSIICCDFLFVSNFLFSFLKKNDATLVRMNYSWLDENSCCVIKNLEGDSFQNAFPPKIDAKQVTKKIVLPGVKLYGFQNAIIGVGSRSVIIEDNRVVIERVETSTDKNNSYVGGQLFFHGKKSCIVRKGGGEVINEGIWISAINDTNYFHWIVEAISQFEYLRGVPNEYKRTPILISTKAKDIPAIKTMIDQLYKGEIIYLHPTRYYKVSKLLMISTPNGLVPNKFTGRWNVEDSYARKSSIFYLRNIGLKMLPALNFEGEVSPKRIFLARKGLLRKYNQSEVIGLLSAYGFQAVYLEDFSFVEQISIINQADYIVGPTGAAWTNIIFANENARALCWMAEELGELSCFSNLAAIVGVDMDYIFYSAGTKNSREIYYYEYRINLKSIEEWLIKNNL